MSFEAVVLADGELPTAQESIYSVPIGTIVAVYIKQLYLYNSNAAEQTISLWLNTGTGTARPWRRLVLAQNESADIFEEGEAVTIEPIHSIEAQTTTAAAISYTLTGVVQKV